LRSLSKNISSYFRELSHLYILTPLSLNYFCRFLGFNSGEQHKKYGFCLFSFLGKLLFHAHYASLILSLITRQLIHLLKNLLIFFDGEIFYFSLLLLFLPFSFLFQNHFKKIIFLTKNGKPRCSLARQLFRDWLNS
jgi:hypothetical protein